MRFVFQEQEQQLGDEQYEQLRKHYRGEILAPDHRASITVRRVGGRLSSAAGIFKQQFINGTVRNNLRVSKPKPYTFTVVRSEMANAFVLPGNHVFVMTGLFKYARDEDELAAVIGHEMAHNLARHAGERMSGSVLMSLFARFTLLLDPSGFLYTLFLPAAALLHDLPNSREAEIEADKIGIHLAAEACYDPRAAKRVFLAMKTGDGDGHNHTMVTPPQFLSTHPSYDTRITNFSDLNFMGDALDRFNSDFGNRCRHVREEMKIAQRQAALIAARRERRLS